VQYIIPNPLYYQINSKLQAAKMAPSWLGSGQEVAHGFFLLPIKVRPLFIPANCTSSVLLFLVINNDKDTMLLLTSEEVYTLLDAMPFVRTLTLKIPIFLTFVLFTTAALYTRTGNPTHHLCKLDPATKKIMIMNKDFVSKARICV